MTPYQPDPGRLAEMYKHFNVQFICQKPSAPNAPYTPNALNAKHDVNVDE